MTTLPRLLEDAARTSADPDAVRVVLERLDERDGGLDALDGELAGRLAAVTAASRSLARLVVSDPEALAALSGPAGAAELAAVRDAESPEELVRRHRLVYLSIVGEDLSGRAALEEVGAGLSALADAVLAAALRLAGAEGTLAVIAMGKHGAEELNYASDVDVVFVAADGADVTAANATARSVLSVAGRCFRVDADLRPEGRNGVLVRSLSSYEAYWERWARPWEFQALVKARASAGDTGVGDGFEKAAGEAVWSRRFDAEALAELRSMKARAEQLVARQGLADRELKRGPGGIRDIEFAAQLLQLVHGRADPALRVRPTLAALFELAAAGYVEGADATVLSLAYRFLRTVEHRLQIVEGAQVHTVPAADRARGHLARVLGFSPAGGAPPRSDRFDTVLARYQSSVRSIHERLFFRPLLEAFAGAGQVGRFGEEAASERLAAFGFKEAERTRQALAELTRGLTRTSRLMQQLLPVLLGWLSETPDPDLGLLGLRTMAAAAHRRDVLVAAFRDSPELARRLCVVLGSSRQVGELALRHPAEALHLGDDSELASPPPAALVTEAVVAADGSPEAASRGLRRIVGEETLRIAASDLLDMAGPAAVSAELAALGDAVLAGALHAASPRLPLGLVAMGRLGGSELAYGSDLDILLVYSGEGAGDAAEAERVAGSLFRILNGTTPPERIWTVDASLRPEGRHGPLARSLAAYREYYRRWASVWERQALVRARPLCGDGELLERFMDLVEETVWEHRYGPDDLREIRRLKARAERERIPAGEDPQFHLKLGRGSLSDVEWTVQLLQLRSGVRSPSTRRALGLVTEAGGLPGEEALVLAEALDFLEATRNRWHLVGNYVAGAGGPVRRSGSDSLPRSSEALTRLARSLGEHPTELRERYRRVTRRARRVVERRFYEL
ncbi:MAG TPA: bifunctional [glutamine synthetase] adenylyltransferase/[glutamine synthetase]-adenylyl-L-tyrosine phosphorylase [Acidimicrobiales bacterium]|nr:bifunctional [glutamine synthetase] adenylyltransferase/[glutamine synthetase]-adenylyl-L-tyrosine phosphorylase [Acidimicrobiales bacterium]